MLKLLSALLCGLLLCACSAQAVDVQSATQSASESTPQIATSKRSATDSELLDAPLASVDLYQQHCAICHLAAGEGVPGAFPPLDERLVRWSQNEAGQDYLASVIANGLYGMLQVNGQQYVGAMPGLAAQLTNAEIAGLLNYVLTEFGGGRKVFTEALVATRLGVIGAGPSLPLRPE